MRDVLSVVQNLPRADGQEFGQQIENRGFTGTVGANQSVNGTATDLQVDVIDRHEPFEFTGQLTGFKNEVFSHFSDGPFAVGQNGCFVLVNCETAILRQSACQKSRVNPRKVARMTK